MRISKNERKRPAEEVSPIITSPPNLRQRKQDEPRTPENKVIIFFYYVPRNKLSSHRECISSIRKEGLRM
jgi:hypothetical protein